MKLAPYPEYKESGVPWLGMIPAHWDSAKLGRIGKTFKTGPFGSILHQSDYVSNGIPIVNPAHMISGRIRPNPHRTITPDTFDRLREYGLAENDIVFSRRGELGRCALVTSREDGYLLGTGSIRVRLREDVVNPEYLLTSYQARWVGDLLSSLSVGATMESLNTGILRQLPALIPPVEEQNQIARFLDWKTAQINKFIRNKRRLIELLKEQKQNVINQAVTRGLNPKVRLKPSGVEWIGDIPEHWEVRRLKFLCHNLNEQTSEKQPGETYIALEHVESWTGRISLPDDEITFDSQVKRFQPGDVLFGKLRPYLAKVTRPQTAGVCVGEFLVLRATGDVSADFLEQKLRSKRVIDLINSSTFGAKMPRADWTFIGNLKFAYPPADQQREILEHIQEKSAEIDQAISRAQREIELIREYRTRLISDVVTGQVDVRVIEVPEVAEEELLALDEDTADADDVIDDEVGEEVEE